MARISDVTTRTIDPGLGLVVYNALIASGVIFFLAFLIIRRSKDWPEVGTVTVGLVLLSM
jgi:hypothetical protein